MDKLQMQSKNLVDENIDFIAKKFPNCITEAMDESGKLTKLVDFDLLKQELSKDIVEGNDERYTLNWAGKKQSILTANSPINATLRPCREESVDFDNTKNLYIEGDNLEVLKILRETYLGKIKMIYIDPPYNTGNDFVYEDDFSLSIEDYLQLSKNYDEQGNQMFQNSESNGRFHSDWLSMMYARLKIAKDLMSEDGVIFISIDDNEVGNLRKLGEMVFGEQNFISNLIWQKKFSRSNDATYFSTMHDHILCFVKNNILYNENGWKIGLLPRNGEIPDGYSNPDNDPRGPWTSVIMSAKSGSESLLYPITTPSGRQVLPPSGRFWSCSKETFERWKSENRIWFGMNGDGSPRKKTFLSEVQDGLRPNTILFHGDVGHNQEAKQETKKLFNDLGVFDGPKPVRLLKFLIQIANLNSSDMVLDFFSGSATTAHAVMELNAEDGGNRKFICVQVPEKCDEKSEAYKAGYKNICEIGKERIRRAGLKIKEENQMTAPNLDIGFRVLKLDSSCMKDVYYSPNKMQQDLLTQLEDNIKEDRTPEDLLFQVMLDMGVLLSSEIKTEIINGKTVFNVNDGDLVCCFDKNLTDDVVTEIAKMQPLYAVFRDSSMSSDSVAVNFDQIFETYSSSTTRRII